MADGNTINIGGVEIDIRANTSGVNRSLVQTEQRARNAGGVMVREFDKADRSAQRLDSTLRRSVSALSLLGGGFAIGAVAKGVIEAADAMTLLRGRIANVITESESLTRVQRDLYVTAQQNRAGITETAQLYLRLRNSVRDLNHEQALSITSTFSKSLVLSGASASEAASSMLQFAQAMGSGRLQGDELRSLLENNTRFARLLADALGVDVGQLKALGEAGALTSKLVSDAISGQASAIEAEFSGIELTVGQAYQKLENAILQYIGNTDQALGVSARFAKGLELVADNVQELGDALLVLGAAGLGAGIVGGGAAGIQRLGVFMTALMVAVQGINERGNPSSGLNKRLKSLQEDLRNAGLEAVRARERVAAAAAVVQGLERGGTATKLNSLAIARQALREAGTAENEAIRRQRQLSEAVGRTAAQYAQSATGIQAGARRIGSTVAAAGGAVLSFFGGPLGVALLATAAAFAIFTARAIEAARATRSIQTGLELVAGLNIDVSKAAHDAADGTDQLTRATENQAAAVSALAEARKDQLRTELQLALNDARKRRDQLEKKITKTEYPGQGIVESDALRGLTFGAGRGIVRAGEMSPVQQLLQLDKTIPILERGIEAVNAGLVDMGEGGKKAGEGLTEAEQALAKFKDAIAAQRSANTPGAFKSTITKNLLDNLAETDLSAARSQFPEVRDLLNDADAVAVQKNFKKIASASIITRTALNEFRTAGEQFAKAIADVRAADPIDGNKSKAALDAVINYGRELKNIPAAMDAIPALSDILKPEDMKTAQQELARLATEAYRSVGTEQQQAIKTYDETVKGLNETMRALIATGAAFDPAAFEAAFAFAEQEKRDALRQWVDDFSEVGALINEMMTPAERLADSLQELASLQAGTSQGPLGDTAIARKRIELLAEEARQAGYAGDALKELALLRRDAGLSQEEARQAGQGIKDAAAQGREGRSDLSDQAAREGAARFFGQTFAEGLTAAVQSGNVGEAFKEVIRNKAAEALSQAFLDVGEIFGNLLFGENSPLGALAGDLFGSGTGSGITQLNLAASQAALAATAEATSATTATVAINLLAAAATTAAASLAAVAGGQAANGVAGALTTGLGAITGSGSSGLYIEKGSVSPEMALKGISGSEKMSEAPPTIRMGDINVAGDVGTQEQLNQIREQQVEQARMLPKVIAGKVADMQRRR